MVWQKLFFFFFIPATGRLSTNRAAESTLKRGVLGYTTTAGAASQHFHSGGAFRGARTNLHTGANLYAGPLHTGALL